jgi:putative membrane-bound dehydrogenase-like protein
MASVVRSSAIVLSLCLVSSLFAADPVFKSKVIGAGTPSQSVKVKADLSGAKKLYLVVSDAGDGFSCDWAGWQNPTISGKAGKKKLTDLKWKSASTGYGQVRLNANCQGRPMKKNGVAVENGIGTHANSVIEYELPDGYSKFEAIGFLDDGGTNQGCGSTVQFLVFTEKPDAKYTAGTASIGLADRTPENALEGLTVNDDLEATLFAAEPMMFSPSNIDIDHKGRVWVCEVVNYRHFRNQNNPVREEGDCILILEDTDGDAQADKKTVFYQGRDIDSAHGVCVLGNRVIVSAGDSVMILTDTDGDDKADKKEILFSGIAGTQHDHGIHSFLFGPDGKLYFNFGNAGKHLYDKDGNPIVDKAGNTVTDDRHPYQDGMAFRCNLDGSDVETLGWNFRNNWELAVDSFGNIWQSDNDDDGNRGVRINFVMEYGNYGYKDELTGAGWRDVRTGMSEDIPTRHWHQKDPGVVPNLLQTGAGSPTGILVYEGDLLPERFINELIHCDAGPNVVRAYHVEADGAGFKAEIENILVGERDKWFRPSDVCMAPDGSLIIADWYDPGVGGHAQGDPSRGRLFRVAPKDSPYKMPKFDFDSVEGAVEALQNPNLATRYLAWTALHEMGEDAEPALQKLFDSDKPHHLRARALWLLGYLPGRGEHYVRIALKDDYDQIRIAGVRLSRRLEMEPAPIVAHLIDDPSPQVRRECAIALADSQSDRVPELWTKLAERTDVHDRWMLEALGIAARGRWDACLETYLQGKNPLDEAPAFFIWRSRATKTPALLSDLIRSPETPEEYLPYLFRSMDFQPNRELLNQELIALAFGDLERTDQVAFVRGEALNRIDNIDFRKNPEYKQALDEILDRQAGTMQFISLVDKFNLQDRYDDLLKLAQQQPDTQEGVAAASLLINKKQWPMLRQAIVSKDPKVTEGTLQALGNTGSGALIGLLMPFVNDDDRDVELRRQAVRALAKTRNGALRLVELANKKELPANLTQAVAAGLHTAQWRDVKEQAEKLFPSPPSKNNKPLPPITELVKRNGDVNRGKLVFNSTGTCAKCHVVNEIGKEVGPDLSEIGSKLSTQAMFESILFPSAGVSHNYETYMIVTEDGTSINGVMVSETPESVTLKGADAIPKTVKKSEIDEMVQQKISLMPADLQKVMTEQELIDVVKYMQTLKKK